MTTSNEPRNERLELPAAGPSRRRWRRGLRSLRALLDDSDDTEKAIDFIYAVGRKDFERTLQRALAGAHGSALFATRPSLADTLSDRESLAAMPAGSFGRAYLEFLERNGFQAMSLLGLDRTVEAKWEAEEGLPRLDPLRSWFRDRRIISHDLYHVLTGYGTDDLGEATLLAFSLGQDWGPGNAVLTLGAALEAAKSLGLRWLLYDLRAWLRGHRALHLAGLPWEELLPMQLDTVRRLVGIEDARRAHPRGILAANLGGAEAAAA